MSTCIRGMRSFLGLVLILALGGCANAVMGAHAAEGASDSGPGESPPTPNDPHGVDAGVAADAGVSDVPKSCEGKPGILRGKVQASVSVGGVTRTFIYYAPEGIHPNTPVPLVLSPHGFGMTAENEYTLTRFKELADVEGFVAIFPDGSAGAPWNVGAGVSGVGTLVNNPSSNDQGFVDAMIDYAKADQCIDEKHVFLSGFSMGGYFSNEVGCVRSDIAGIGPHSGGSHDLASCTGSIKPVILFHGARDPLITYKDNGLLARDRWVARNGCSNEADSMAVKGGHCDYHRGCPAHSQVVFCHFDQMVHAWAGGAGTINSDPTVESASALAWKFWREYAW